MTISQNQILVVTGDPRSGTSLMMQTLQHLGLKLSGDEFPREDQFEGEQLEKMKNKNPGGFYEVPGVVMQGTRRLEDYGGTVLKVISPGAYEHEMNNRFVGTPESLIWKRIFCLRHPKPVAVSQSKLQNQVQVSNGEAFEDLETEVNATRYLHENGGLAQHIIDNDLQETTLVIDYDDIVSKPKETIDRVIAFIETSPTSEQIQNANDNIQPKLRRSEQRDWNTLQKQRGETAENLYAAIKQMNKLGILTAQAETKGYIEFDRINSQVFYDVELDLMCGMELLNQLKMVDGLKETLLKNTEKRRKAGYIVTTSENFSQPENIGTYTIQLPAEHGGDLTRKYVKYKNETVTWEEAHHWHMSEIFQ